jgi:hypothetical protein
MKPIFFFLFTLLALNSYGQRKTHHIHHFPNGKVSTIAYLDDEREGKAIAYNLKGEIIYERHIRRIHGSSSVRFTHHPNGMVHKADYSSQPDGGIQWYKTFSEFNDKGELISEFEDNYEGPGRISPRVRIDTNPEIPVTPNVPTLPEEVQETKPQPQKEIAVCASIHENSVEIVNHTQLTIKVTFYHRGDTTTVLLSKGQTAKGPTYISAEISSPVADNVKIELAPIRKRANLMMLTKSNSFEQYKTKHVIHVFESARKDLKQ